MTDIEIFDNFLPEIFSHSLDPIINGEDIPWYLVDSLSGWELPSNIDGIKVAKNQQGFYHLLFDDKVCSPFYELFAPILPIIEEKTKSTIKMLFRMRLGLTTAAQEGGIIYPHVDYSYPHKTFLIYLNESDGDTFFYNEKYQGYPESNFTFLQKNSPKKNQGVLFDGLRYHSSSVPQKYDKRIAININYY